MQNNLIIGISGFARSGKDTAAAILESYLNSKNKKAKIFSFAHSLKKDIDQFCIEKIGISAFVTDTNLKTKIRPMLISYGLIKRSMSKGTYWINKIKPEIDLFFEEGGIVAIVPDLRFKEFEYDELDFIKSYKNNICINIEKIKSNGKKVSAAHESELKSSSLIRRAADLKVIWNSSSDKEYLKHKLKKTIDLVNLKLIS